MTDKYITSSQYREGLYSIKDYIDKSIPHREDPEVLITITAVKVIEIYNSTNKTMEFDKPSNIDLNSDFIISYNNENTIGNIGKNDIGKYIYCINDNIDIMFFPGIDINHNANENKMVVCVNNLNTSTLRDLILKQVKTKYLNNKYLKKDVVIQNSIIIGSRQEANTIGKYSFSNGSGITASGDGSHAEGFWSSALSDGSHAEGSYSEASGDSSHAEGSYTTASGDGSHAEGGSTTASGYYSHAEGYNTKASSQNQHVQGKYNIEDTENKYAHIVGNGTNDSTRSNAHTLDWNGNAWFAGKLSQEGLPVEDKDLTIKKYVDGLIESSKITMCTDESVNNMLIEVLGGDYSGN